MRWMLAAIALTVASPALANSHHGHRAEVSSDRAQQRDNRAELDDDLADLDSIEAIARDWQRARRYGDRSMERRADRALERYLAQELAEARVEYREDKREYRGATNEAHRSGSRDDRYDRADDRSDMSSARRDRARIDDLARELRDLQRAFDYGYASGRDDRAKSRLIHELESMARAEIVADKAEIREDRAEAREDRYAYGSPPSHAHRHHR